MEQLTSFDQRFCELPIYSMGGHKNDGKVTDGEQDQIGRSNQPNLLRYARTKKENH